MLRIGSEGGSSAVSESMASIAMIRGTYNLQIVALVTGLSTVATATTSRVVGL